MQTGHLKILPTTLFLFLSCAAHSQTIALDLKRADSLFKARQYTQSFDNYQLVWNKKYYTPAMLLKMAYIQEGLGHVSRSIYYLQHYHKITHDQQALEKIEELAAKNKLEGYKADTFLMALSTLRQYHITIMGVLAAFAALFMALIVFQKRKKIQPIGAFVGLVFFLLLIFVQTNWVDVKRQGIVSQPATYLMSGPSAGASVVAIIEEGHQLKIKGKKDVWLRVEWLDQDVYIKEDRLLKSDI